MRIGLRALGLTGLLMVALYSGQPIHAWLLRIQASYNQTQQQRNLDRINSNIAAMKSGLEAIMATVMVETPSFSRVRVAAIHNLIATDSTTPLVFDVVSTMVVSGHAPGDLVINLPISQMGDYLGSLLKQECALVAVSMLSDLGTAARMNALGIQAFLACPILNEKGDLLGVIYGTWDLMWNIPDDLEPIKKRLMKAGRKIGSTIKLVN